MATTIVSMLDLSFVQNLSEGDEMEMTSGLTRSMFKDVSLFSQVYTRRRDVLALGNILKECNI